MSSDAPPRKLDAAEPGFNVAIGDRIEIFLDGIEQTEAIAYDQDAGWIRRYRLDREGKAIPVGRGLAVELAYGEVEVFWRREA